MMYYLPPPTHTHTKIEGGLTLEQHSAPLTAPMRAAAFALDVFCRGDNQNYGCGYSWHLAHSLLNNRDGKNLVSMCPNCAKELEVKIPSVINFFSFQLCGADGNMCPPSEVIEVRRSPFPIEEKRENPDKGFAFTERAISPSDLVWWGRLGNEVSCHKIAELGGFKLPAPLSHQYQPRTVSDFFLYSKQGIIKCGVHGDVCFLTEEKKWGSWGEKMNIFKYFGGVLNMHEHCTKIEWAKALAEVD